MNHTLRVVVLTITPILLLATFITNELALSVTIDPVQSEFTAGYRKIVYNTLFVPWFLGVLLGHWYHPFVDRTFMGREFLIRTLIVAGVALVLGLVFGLLLAYVEGFAIPYWASTIIMYAGVVVGAWVWPVRVFSRI